METVLQRSKLIAKGSLTAVEATAMLVEKPVAFAEGTQDAALAFARGESPSAIFQAGLRPVARATERNAKRLRT